MNKADLTNIDMPNYERLVEQSMSFKKRGWAFVIFIVLLSIIAVLATVYFNVKFDFMFNIILTFTSVFGLIWFALYIAGYTRFGSDDVAIPNFAGIADGLKDAIVITANNGLVVYSNDAYIRLARIMEAVESSGKNAPEITFSGDPVISAELFKLANAAKKGLDHYTEIRLKSAANHSTGKSLWVSIQVTKIVSGNFKGGALWQIQDISGRSDRQEMMINKLKQTIDYLEDAPVGFLSTKPDGEITFMNSTLAQWLGGKTGSDFEKKKINRVVGDNGAMILNYKSQNFEKSDNINVDQTSYVDFFKTDGESFPVKIIHRVKVEQGDVKKISSFILPESSADDKLADVNADILFSRFFNYSPLGMAALDKNGVVLSANPSFRDMFSGQKVASNSLTNLVSDSSKKSIERAIEQALVGKIEAVPIDYSSGKDERHSGQLYFNRVRAGLGGVDGDEENIQLIAYVFDTTQQRTLEAQFAQGQKMQAIGQLAGGIAHDFNNVLTAILGNCELLLSEIKSSDPSFADLMGIKNNTNRAASLVGQILAFSRQQTMRPTLVILSDLLADMSVLFTPLKGKNVNIELYHARDLGLVKVDKNQLEQVMVNLVVNAGHAMPDGGDLSIKTSNVSRHEIRELDRKEIEIQDYVKISVSDTGTGMPLEVQKKIFELYYTTKDIGKGTGLGLSTVYGIIKQTDGYIYVDSEVGEGTTFDIYLPRQYPSEEEIKKITNQYRVKKEKLKDLSGKGTILLVDDEEGVRSFAVRALQARGYDMLQAENGAEALEILNNHDGEINLIISDVMMPEMDGPTMYNNLPEKYKKITTIFMSGYAEEVYRDQIAENAKIGFLSKPVGIKKLAETVKLYIDSD
ncbi:MAG: response regulator [Rhizobiales bacterium]|nr:response regulator [Hyphomicrobiales bacterium]